MIPTRRRRQTLHCPCDPYGLADSSSSSVLVTSQDSVGRARVRGRLPVGVRSLENLFHSRLFPGCRLQAFSPSTPCSPPHSTMSARRRIQIGALLNPEETPVTTPAPSLYPASAAAFSTYVDATRYAYGQRSPSAPAYPLSPVAWEKHHYAHSTRTSRMTFSPASLAIRAHYLKPGA